MIKWHNPAYHPHGNCITKKSYCWCKGKTLFSSMQNIAFENCKLGRGSQELFLPPSLCALSLSIAFFSLIYLPSYQHLSPLLHEALNSQEKGASFFLSVLIIPEHKRCEHTIFNEVNVREQGGHLRWSIYLLSTV